MTPGWTILLTITTVALATSWTAGAEPGAQRAETLEIQVPVQLKYWLYLPAEYDDGDDARRWPLMLFLHGAGERGDDLERVKIHGPAKLIAAGKDFPMIVLSPQCKQNLRWQPQELSALLDHIVETYRVDEERIYVTGLSMGGFGTWALARYAPQRFAAIAPICGGGETDWAKDIARLPVWVFHGAKDPVVPLERSESMVDALREAGNEQVKFTIYPDAMHDSWTQTYEDPELYEWLLSHQRQP